MALKVEFEIPDAGTVALHDEYDFTIFFHQSTRSGRSAGVALTFQADDVEATHRRLAAAGVAFVHPPQRVFWGYGAELVDPEAMSSVSETNAR